MTTHECGYPRRDRDADDGVHELWGGFCRGDCPDGLRPVLMNPLTGRYYIAAGHCAFNSRANNGNGYASPEAAIAAMRRATRGGAQ